jgi:AcrR family transcriptional regulator
MQRRSYRSRLRQERATDTRERIVDAARDLFARRGLEGATIAAIAEHAGVATPTVYATFGSKREIMAALLARAEAEADRPAWFERIGAELDPEAKIHLFAEWSKELFTSIRDLITAIFHGPAGSELVDEGNRRRREAIDALIASLAAESSLRADLGIKEAADRAWMLTGPEIYLLATSCGWPDEQYQEWLADLLTDQVLRRD